MGDFGWMDNHDYPSDKDMEELGEGAPLDDDPLSIGYIGDNSPRVWTAGRIAMLIMALFLALALILPWLF